MRPHITGDMTVAELADLWLRHLRAENRLENTTINEYERVLNKLVLPELGPVSFRGLTTRRIDNLLHDLGAQSLNRQRKARVITGAMLTWRLGRVRSARIRYAGPRASAVPSPSEGRYPWTISRPSGRPSATGCARNGPDQRPTRTRRTSSI